MYDSSRLKHANNRPASRQRRWSDCLRAEPFADTRRERETVWTESWCLTPALLWSRQVSLWRFQETSGCQCLSVHSQNVIMLLVDDWARVPENLSTCCGTEIASPHPGFRVFSVFFHDHFKCFPLKNDRQHTHTHTYRRILIIKMNATTNCCDVCTERTISRSWVTWKCVQTDVKQVLIFSVTHSFRRYCYLWGPSWIHLDLLLENGRTSFRILTFLSFLQYDSYLCTSMVTLPRGADEKEFSNI